jgi:Iap family predicted aminopeptidase
MDQHRLFYPQVLPAGTLAVETSTLDELLRELDVDSHSVDLVNIDVQGAELAVLRGASAVLRHAKAVYVEVSFTELYKGCAQIDEVEDLLQAAGFQRVALLSSWHQSRGDACYVRRDAPSVAPVA